MSNRRTTTYKRNGTILERIQYRMKIVDDCWELYLSPSNRYAFIRVNGKKRLAHRVLYEFINGKLEDGLVIDHLCRNTACVNPMHLEAVTQLENVNRSPFVNLAKCRWAGHPYTIENTYINPNGRKECRKCRADKRKNPRRTLNAPQTS